MKRFAMALVLLMAAGTARATDGVSIARDGEGYCVTTDVYAARVDATGTLFSLVIAGQEFMAPATESARQDRRVIPAVFACPMNQFYLPAPMPGAPAREGDVIRSEGNGWKLGYSFGTNTIDVTYSGQPEGTHGFRAGYPPTELCLSLAHDLARSCDTESQGEFGWPCSRATEPGNFAVLASNGAGFVAQDVCRLQAVKDPGSLRAAPNRLDLLVFSTYDQTPQPITHRLTLFRKADLAHALVMEIVSPNPGHLFPGADQVVFPVKVRVLYGHTLHGGLAFDGAPYVWKKPPLQSAVPLELAPEQAERTVELTIKPPKAGHYTGKVSVTDGARPLYSQRVGFAFRPEQIPAAKPPPDFDAFWADTLAQLEKIPLDLTLEEQVDKATPAGKVFKAKYRSWGGRWAWAWLNVPKAATNVDGTIILPAVSVWQPPPPQSADGQLRISVAVHGGDLKDYPAKSNFDYMNTGIESRETYMLRYSYCCLARCFDILKARPECNGTIHARGGSQGAGLSLVLAGLRPVADARGAAIALCRIDWTILGYSEWGPRLPAEQDPQKIAAVVSYFDPANFAHRIHAPLRLAFGLFDFCAPAEGIFTAINALPPDTKCEVFVDPYGGHFTLNARGFDANEPGVTIPRWQGTAADNKLVR